ncbi:LysR family transcriptional regulator [Nonomuraea sp. NPDC059194]|uniref:LysR family transcriptional regulator n=1 Tax=Nonomuraea sp. NPDC059194 TaxID=3346764 RepID=UPI00368BC928
MDLDLAQVRAFVLTAEELHFGRAAELLAISQQAVSKRISGLENALGVRLFDRGGPGVRLTPYGERLLGPARRVLAAGEAAVASVGAADRPVRVDVWGHLFAPMRTLARIAARPEAPALELGHGRDLASVAASLQHHEIDAGFGRIHPPLPADLAHQLIRLEPVDAILSADHPLAGEPQLRPEQLRGSVLRTPGPLDRLDFLRRFADDFDIRDRVGAANLGPDHFVAQIAGDPRCFSLLPADTPLPELPGLPGVRSVPLVEPTPLYAWSLLWRRDDAHPLLDALVAVCVRQAGRDRWLEYDPRRDWLPE